MRKISLISKFLTSQPGQQKIPMANISRSQDNQAMKFGHLIKHNMRNIFLKKLCRKCGGKTI